MTMPNKPINYHLFKHFTKFTTSSSSLKKRGGWKPFNIHTIHAIHLSPPEDPLMARQVSPFGVKTSPGPAKRSMIPSLDSNCSRPAKTMHLSFWDRCKLGKVGKIGDLGTCFFWGKFWLGTWGWCWIIDALNLPQLYVGGGIHPFRQVKSDWNCGWIFGASWLEWWAFWIVGVVEAICWIFQKTKGVHHPNMCEFLKPWWVPQPPVLRKLWVGGWKFKLNMGCLGTT